METKLISIIKELVDKDNYLGDDCAVVELGNEKYLFALDSFIENTHFKTEYFSAYDIGWKALAVNISDIAAMAGIPLMALVGLNLRKNLPDKEVWVKEFYSGMQACAESFGGVKIIGGDLCSSENEISVSVSIIGKAHEKGVLYRNGAKAGNKVCVTGSFGNSAKFLQKTTPSGPGPSGDIFAQAHLRPIPRVNEAQKIWKNNSRGALMDASDGLAQALIELAERNRAELEITTEQIPRDPSVDLSLALYGGEDYELVGCFSEVPEGFLLIGNIKKLDSKPKVILQPNGEILTKSEIYRHF